MAKIIGTLCILIKKRTKQYNNLQNRPYNISKTPPTPPINVGIQQIMFP